jgi:hypothetical protein
MPESAIPAYITSLIRHCEDLRDGTHGGAASRHDKEAHFEKAVHLLAPIARQVLTENTVSVITAMAMPVRRQPASPASRQSASPR